MVIVGVLAERHPEHVVLSNGVKIAVAEGLLPEGAEFGRSLTITYTTDGDDVSFTVLQRATGRRVELPADPKLSQDRARLVTADFCATRCVDELAVWRVTREGIRKE